MDISKHIYTSFFEKSVANVSLMGLIESNIKKLNESSPAPSDYYYLTDLTNPQQKFWKFETPRVKRSHSLAKKLILGNRLQTRFSKWCRALPGFMVEEGALDGSYVGIPKVKGRVDYIIDGSIIELKTKEKIPTKIEEIFEKYPNDLEQLVFYSALHPSQPTKNILLFMESKNPFDIQAFEVTTKDFNGIKTMINQRIKLLDDTLMGVTADKNFKKLGKCRYFDGGCEYREAGVCSCDKLQIINLTKLKECIEIKIAKEFKSQLMTKRKEFDEATSFEVYPNNILAPRQQFIKNVLGIEREPFEGSNEKFVFESCLFTAITKSGLTKFTDIEKERLKAKLFDMRLTVPFKWIKIQSSSSEKETEIPYITTVSLYDKSTGNPSQYHVALLGIICASHGISKGLIVTIFPKLDKAVNVFEIKFKDNEIKNTQELVRNIINDIESAQKEEHLHMLRPCPGFMDNKADCPIRDKCKEIKSYCNP